MSQLRIPRPLVAAMLLGVVITIADITSATRGGRALLHVIDSTVVGRATIVLLFVLAASAGLLLAVPTAANARISSIRSWVLAVAGICWGSFVVTLIASASFH